MRAEQNRPTLLCFHKLCTFSLRFHASHPVYHSRSGFKCISQPVCGKVKRQQRNKELCAETSHWSSTLRETQQREVCCCTWCFLHLHNASCCDQSLQDPDVMLWVDVRTVNKYTNKEEVSTCITL